MINKMVYFAYPIDRADSSGGSVRAIVRRVLRERFKVVFDPGQGFSVNTMDGGDWTSPQIRDVNMSALDAADVLVVSLSGAQPSWGVPSEVERAVGRGIPVLIFTDSPPTWSMRYTDSNVRVVSYNSWEDHETFAKLVESAVERIPDGGERVLPYVFSGGGSSRTPTRAYADDAGLDLYVSTTTEIPPGEFRDVPCGVAVELPEGTWGLLVGRSSTLRKKRLLVNLGVIDVGYRGPLFAGVQNIDPEETRVVTAGERVAQLIVLPNLTEGLVPKPVTSLSDHPRGLGGFGSSGD